MRTLEEAVPEKVIAYIRECGEAAIRNRISSCEGFTHPRQHNGTYVGVKFGWVDGPFGPIPQRFWVHVEGRDNIDERYTLEFDHSGYDLLQKTEQELAELSTGWKSEVVK